MPDPHPKGTIFVKRIAAINATVGSIIFPLAPTAKTENQFLFDPDLENWANLLLNVAKSEIELLQVYDAGLRQGPGAPVASVDPIVLCGIDYFVPYDRTSGDHNSQKRLRNFFALAFWELAAFSDLKMNDATDEEVRGCVSSHRGLSVPVYGIKEFGDEKPVHYGRATIEVIMESQHVWQQN